MKCRLPHSAERSGRDALLIFIHEKMSNGSFKLHLRWGGIPTPRFAAYLQHIFRTVGMYRDATLRGHQSAAAGHNPGWSCHS